MERSPLQAVWGPVRGRGSGGGKEEVGNKNHVPVVQSEVFQAWKGKKNKRKGATGPPEMDRNSKV